MMRWFWKRPSMVAPMLSSLSMTEISDLSRHVFVFRCCGPGKSFGDWQRKPINGKRRSEFMRRSNFALRVPPTLLAEARKAAESDGVALNQLITLALAEKVSAMRTEEYFEERARRADPTRVSRILARVGKGNPPVEGDELPLGFVPTKARKKEVKRKTVS